MSRIIGMFEKIIIGILLIFMIFVVLISVVELLVIVYQYFVASSILLLNVKEMLSIFGLFLIVLIGLELMESVKAYLEEDNVHAEIVFLVAIVAVTRKIIILDYENVTPGFLFGIATIILALSMGYYLVRKGLAVNNTFEKFDK